MVKIKPLEEISKRYEEAATIVPARYKRAIEKVSDWKTPALEGQELYETKMSMAEIRARRAKAIEAILTIEREAHTVGLTEKIEKMLRT